MLLQYLVFWSFIAKFKYKKYKFQEWTEIINKNEVIHSNIPPQKYDYFLFSL